MIGNEGGIEYHEEPIEYHDQECYFFSRLRLKYDVPIPRKNKLIMLSQKSVFEPL